MYRLADKLNITPAQSQEINNSILNFIKFIYKEKIVNLKNTKSETIYNLWIKNALIPKYYKKNNIIFITETCKLIENYKNNIEKYPLEEQVYKTKYRLDLEYLLNKILAFNNKYIKNIDKYSNKQLKYLINKYMYINSAFNNKDISLLFK